MSEQISRLTNATVSNPAEYGPLRERGPVLRTVIDGVELPVWFISDYEECKEALNDPRFIRDATKLPGREGPGLAEQMLGGAGLPEEYFAYFGNLSLSDGEEHTRLRNAVARAFTARRVNALRPSLERTASDLYAALSAKKEADLVAELGYPFATAAICELMDIEEADRPQLQSWVLEMLSYDPELFVPAVRGIVEYYKDLIARRRAEPTDDLVSELLKPGGIHHDLLAEDAIISIFMLLTSTGIAPPAHFLGQALLTLLNHPEELAELRRRPELLAKRAVPELLRYTTSAPTGGPLHAAEDFEFHGCPVKQGDAVVPSLIGSNHDPKRFTEPQRLDLARDLGPGVGHLAFGSGPHYCTGASLAQLETEVVIDTFLLKNRTVELAVEPDQLPYVDIPGKGAALGSLPVRF
ncbi:cytochrome P450 [Streptomyces longispororuber]|uniref:Cytochrome P450 n=1 Tax=Streptomyces longispororuber TaxID=68230 RepID=A0A918ZZE3_9ACTN|nr:cytochrome P450 [Streptomyces longispororuber]GHE79529.1 cytochrome P450 [Streptomyces longispororuber]